MMKRRNLLMLLGSICLILVVVAACAKPLPTPPPTPAPTPTPTPAPTPTPTPATPRTIVIGGWYRAGSPIELNLSIVCTLIEQKTTYKTKIVGGLGLDSPERFWPLVEGKHDITFGVGPYTLLYDTLKRLDPILAPKVKYLALIPHYWQPIPLIVRRDLPISSVKDAIDKKYPLKVAVGRAGSYEVIDAIWDVLGAPDGVDAVKQWGGKLENMSAPTADVIGPMVREGVLNAYMGTGNAYEPAWEEVNKAIPLKLLPISDNESDVRRALAAFRELGPYVMKPATAGPGNYSFVTKDTLVCGIHKFMIGGPSLSEVEAYTIAKVVWEARDYLSKVVSAELSRALVPEVMRHAYEVGIPFHPGAERYYREAGVFK